LLIGAQIYGLRESPFINDPASRCVDATATTPTQCHFEFLAQTTSLRNSQTFFVRDLAWDEMQVMGQIAFLPSFTAAKLLATPAAPVITKQPTNLAVVAGQSAKFSVTATSTLREPVRYEWLRDDETINGANKSSYTIQSASVSDDGARFAVTVSNYAGTVNSDIATLSVTALPMPPSITKQPNDQTTAPGEPVKFAVEVAGTPPFSYQWQKNDKNIKGATSSTYTLPSAKVSDNGAQFRVFVRNTIDGKVKTSVSSWGTLSVNPKPSGSSAVASQVKESTMAATYEISGYDLAKFAANCDGTFQAPCLHIYADSTPLDSDALTVMSDNLATVEGVPLGTKSLWFQIYTGESAFKAPRSAYVWELAIPKSPDDSSTSIVGVPAFVYVGDTETVSFSSPSFSAFSNVTGPIPMTFNGAAIAGTYDTKKNLLRVQITTDMTKMLGHKELIVAVPSQQPGGAATPVTLSFDVVKQIIKE
jgi:hypothetical protein